MTFSETFLVFLVILVVFLGVRFGFRKSCLCKRNDKYKVWVQIHLWWILTNLESRKTNLNWKMHQVLHSSLLRRHLWTNNWHITSLVKFKFVAMPFSANINKKDTQIIFIAKFPAFQTFNVRLAKISFWLVFFIFCVERL